MQGLRGEESSARFNDLSQAEKLPVNKDLVPAPDNKGRRENNWTSVQIWFLRFVAGVSGLVVLYGVAIFGCLSWNYIGHVLQDPLKVKMLLGDFVQVILTALATLFIGDLFKK